MTQEQVAELLSKKPELFDVKDKIKYAVFVTLVQRGWKGVGSSYSGVLTKNGFVLNLYKSDATATELEEPSEYLVPSCICYFSMPNTSWTLERYNKLYGYGRLQSIWDFLYDRPEEAEESTSFMKFINEVDTTASLSTLELQSMGQMYQQDDYMGYIFSVHQGAITDTGLFMSRVDFGAIRSKTAYKINRTEKQDGQPVFILTQIDPPSQFETILPLEDFGIHYQAGDLVVLSVKQELQPGELQLVQASANAKSGLPAPIEALSFSNAKQSILGTALQERLFITPLLTATEDNISKVYELLKLSSEYLLLTHLPNNSEMLDVLLEYARAGFSLYQPLKDGSASDAQFELTELLEMLSESADSMAVEIGAASMELWKYEKTFAFDIPIERQSSINYSYLQALLNRGYFTKMCTPLLENSMVNKAGALYLHRVYVGFDVQNELRSFFFEEGMEKYLEHAMSEFTHLYFDWREGFGLCCVNYTIVRVPGGYKILSKDNLVLGFILKVNGEVYSYGDLACLRK